MIIQYIKLLAIKTIFYYYLKMYNFINSNKLSYNFSLVILLATQINYVEKTCDVS